MKPEHLICMPDIAGLAIFNGPEETITQFDEIIDQLQGELLELNEQVNNIQSKADGESRELTEDETTEVNDLMAQFEQKEEEIQRRERMKSQALKLQLTFGRKTEPQNLDNGESQSQRRQVPATPRSADSGRWGWRSFGEFAFATLVASAKGGKVDPRLVANAPTTYSSEGVGEDGGFMVPPDFKTEIMKKVNGVDSLLSRTDMQTTGKNSMTFNADETAPWASSGIRAYWQDEAAQMNQNKPVLKDKTIRLNKLTCLVPVTDEQLEDAPGLGSFLNSKVPEAFDWKLQDALINGTGSGQFTGILASPALVSVGKDTVNSPVQAADTFTYRNVVDMWNRMYAKCRKNAVWLINQDLEPQLDLMQFVPNSNQPIPVYMPAGGASASPYATLKGRPVIPVEACQALGDKGDVILADLSQYMTLMKTSGIRQDVSIHLYFDYGLTAFRYVFRIGGMPWWGSAITLPNSTLTRSCFVTLDERA